MSTISTILGDLFVDDHGTAEEPVAFLWPSLFCDHTMYDGQISMLQGLGFKTIAIDPPGHGKSPGPGRRFTMEECAQAVIQILDAVEVRTPVIFFGTSWGGFVAPRLALIASDRIHGLILFNTSADRPPLLDRCKTWLLTKLFVVGALHDKMAGTAVTAMLSPSTQAKNPDIAKRLTAGLTSWNASRVSNAIRSVLVDRSSILERLADIETPALVVSGKDDPIFPAEHSERIVAKLPNARHAEVSGAAHLVPLEVPQAANALIVDFVRTLSLVRDVS